MTKVKKSKDPQTNYLSLTFMKMKEINNNSMIICKHFCISRWMKIKQVKNTYSGQKVAKKPSYDNFALHH